jgi:multidrug efflux pump subunit AcrB
VHDLTNTIIIGFLLVTLVLMFFMGTTNAMFVGLSVPLSSFLAFLIMPGIDFTMNMIVLFALLMALGVVVDDAIVVIENTHRLFANGKKRIDKAAKEAAGEVFMPVLAGTLTTIAPFLPLAFWNGVVGKFMFFLPITLILTLCASLIVAYLINPAFAVQFMKPELRHPSPAQLKRRNKSLYLVSGGLVLAGIMGHLMGSPGLANFLIVVALLLWINRYVFTPLIMGFQERLWPAVQSAYDRFLRICLNGRLKVDFFPSGDPNFVYVYLSTPVGSDQRYTDSLTRVVEAKVARVLGQNNPLVESVIANVTVGAGDPMAGDQAAATNKAKVTVAMVEYARRNGVSTKPLLDSIRLAVRDLPGLEVSVDQERGGPPTGKPINIEIAGDDFSILAATSVQLKKYLDSLDIAGVEELKSNLELNKPVMTIKVDRERAQREGISTAQIGSEIRAAVFGKEVSQLRVGNDEIPIQLRYDAMSRSQADRLINARITFRDMNSGGAIRQIPLSSVATLEFGNSYGSIRRKNEKRVVTISSNVLSGYTANEVVAEITEALEGFPAPEGYSVVLTGEQEEQAEAAAFLSRSLLISIGLIFLILVVQFNSLNKTLIIMSGIVLSIIGVLLGFVATGMNMSVVMSGIGLVALAGIVVKNGILMVEFTDLLLKDGRISVREAIIEAGKIRMAPVLLTAFSTVLGLVPLAVGLNMDFGKLLTELNPGIYFGGDSVAFFGPLSWTIIFGLTFATFLTLVFVPVLYYITHRNQIRRRFLMRKIERATFGVEKARSTVEGLPA